MKIKKGYILKEVGGNKIVAPTAGVAEFKGMIVLNATGAFLWEKLLEDTTQEELVKALLDEYDVEEEIAKGDVSAFIEKLKQADLLA